MNGYNPNHIAANRKIHAIVETAKHRVRTRTECGIRLRTFRKSDGATNCVVCSDLAALQVVKEINATIFSD